MIKTLLLGKNGQLGWEAYRTFSCLGEVTSVDYPEVDFTRPESLAELVERVRPQVVFNAVAYTAVDQAEREIETARLINASAPEALARAARTCRAVFVHISTDYVLDGSKDTPYVENDPTHPLNAYGQTKLEGEQAVAAAGGCFLTLRTSWVYSMRRDSFVNKVLEWSRKNPQLRVVDDQISNPTWARMLAETIGMLIARAGADPYQNLESRSGLYHLAGAGWCSRYEWAQEILKNDPDPAARPGHVVVPAKSVDFPTPALRPLLNRLDCAKFTQTFDLELPDWRSALRLAMG
jgi:dTDP-4-dehydrorhamnose reductase